MVQNAQRQQASPLVGKSRKQRTEAAIAAALAGDWKRAAAENRALLDEDKRDVEAANRLGKSLTELGQKKQAIDAYTVALEIDSANAIARKNLARLEVAKTAKNVKARLSAPPELAKPATSLIEASDRAAEFGLQQPNLRALAKLDPGDPAQLEATPRGIAVKSLAGEVLGYIEPRAGLRLRRMIEGGNRYAAVVRNITKDGAIVHVRETYKHPSLVGQASFLQSPTARRRLFRAYTKTAVVRYDRDADFENEGEESEEPAADAWRPRPVATDDDDESAEVSFPEDVIEVDDDDEIEVEGEEESAADDDEDEEE